MINEFSAPSIDWQSASDRIGGYDTYVARFGRGWLIRTSAFNSHDDHMAPSVALVYIPVAVAFPDIEDGG